MTGNYIQQNSLGNQMKKYIETIKRLTIIKRKVKNKKKKTVH